MPTDILVCWTARSIARIEVLFASLQHHCFWCFFWFRGPKLCPNRTGNTKFYKNLTRVRAYTRFPWSQVCPGTSRNKGNFSEKFPFSVFPDQLEQNSDVFGFFRIPDRVTEIVIEPALPVHLRVTHILAYLPINIWVKFLVLEKSFWVFYSIQKFR